MTITIAIDGRAGTGKSTTAKCVARELNVPLLNTGQLYRAVGFIVERVHGRKAEEEAFAAQIAVGLSPVIEEGEVVSANGHDMRGALRADDMSHAASVVSSFPEVRRALLGVQQTYAAEHGAVMEGRDIGMVILPDATLKVYLSCDPRVRAYRRGLDGSSEDEAAMDIRDNRDSVQSVKADDAIEIDTTHMSVGEVVQEILHRLWLTGWKRRAQMLAGAAEESVP